MTPEAAEALRRAAETPVEASVRDLDAVAGDLSAAFATYPMFEWIMRPDARRDAARLKFFKRMLADTAFASGTVLRPEGGGAASVWLASEKLMAPAFWNDLLALPTLLGATGLARFGRLAALRKAMEAHHPMNRRHAYLWLIGVRPEAQGSGIGSRLLAAGLARVDAQGRPAFLETSTEANVALYRRHGFEVASTYDVQPGSPPSWAMWRPAPA